MQVWVGWARGLPSPEPLRALGLPGGNHDITRQYRPVLTRDFLKFERSSFTSRTRGAPKLPRPEKAAGRYCCDGNWNATWRSPFKRVVISRSISSS